MRGSGRARVKLRAHLSGAGTRLAAALLLLLASGLLAAVARERFREAAAGERLYREGILPNGQLLRGERAAAPALVGAEAACVACHRRSGLGSYEGAVLVPPIIGPYLFRSGAENVRDPALPHLPGFAPRPSAYTHETFGAALHNGTGPDGRTLNFLMPRYALDAASLAALEQYLWGLSRTPGPGVSDVAIDFATIVTPDADPPARDAMIAVLQRFFDQHNEQIAAEVRPASPRREDTYRVARRWQLHIWTLRGPSVGWSAQLTGRMHAEPVFAVISGIGGRNWRPIHEFCEREELPCLLPNTEVPVTAEKDFYPIYFSRGVYLEADLLAHQLRQSTGAVIQVFRRDDVGASAAAALRARLRAEGQLTNDVPLEGHSPRSLRELLVSAKPGARIVLWLRPADLRSLPSGAAQDVQIYASGLMAGLERAPLAESWMSKVVFTYPFELPEQRRPRMNFPLAWFRAQQIPVTDERIQSDTYVACQVLSEALGHMLDSFIRELLVERVEMMLGTHLTSGYYPRLGLAPGQRFASKGGYLVQLQPTPAAGSAGAEQVARRVKPLSGWLVP